MFWDWKILLHWNLFIYCLKERTQHADIIPMSLFLSSYCHLDDWIYYWNIKSMDVSRASDCLLCLQWREKFSIWLIPFFPLLNNPDWWCITAIRTLTLEWHMRMNLLAYEFRVGNLCGCCRKCTSLNLFNRSIATMMITVVVNAMSKLEFRAVGAGPNASCSLLIAIANVAMLISGGGMRCEKDKLSRRNFTHRCRWCYHVGQVTLKNITGFWQWKFNRKIAGKLFIKH